MLVGDEMFHGGMLWGEHLRVIYEPFAYITRNIGVPYIVLREVKLESERRPAKSWVVLDSKQQDVKQANLFES